MIRGVQALVLAVLIAGAPVVRLACDLACVPVPVEAAVPSHCGAHPVLPDSAPSFPQDRCGHDHQPVRFIGAAAQAELSPDVSAAVHPRVQLFDIPASFVPRAEPVARGGPSPAARSVNLRI